MEDTDLSWRKSSYSGNGGATCVEVGNADRVLVRDTQDRTGPVLRFSPAAWRRFADQVKRSLADRCRSCRGALDVEGAPSACPGSFPRGRRGAVRFPRRVRAACPHIVFRVPRSFVQRGRSCRGRQDTRRAAPARAVPECRRVSPGFRLCRGRCGIGVGCGRVACPRAGEAGGGPREPGTGLWGGPGSPGACSFRRPEGAVRYARRPGQFSSVICSAGCVVVCRGGRNGGPGENLEPGRGFSGSGEFRVFPQCVSELAPSCLFTRVVEPFLTSASCSLRG
jgi:hypothetical protein